MCMRARKRNRIHTYTHNIYIYIHIYIYNWCTPHTHAFHVHCYKIEGRTDLLVGDEVGHADVRGRALRVVEGGVGLAGRPALCAG